MLWEDCAGEDAVDETVDEALRKLIQCVIFVRPVRKYEDICGSPAQLSATAKNKLA
jgi:hypothetical protein